MKTLAQMTRQLTKAEVEAEYQVLRLAAENGDLTKVKKIVKEKAVIISRYFPDALCKAAMNGHTPVAKFLIDYGVSVNAVDEYGQGSLFFAAAYGRSDIVDLLLAVPGINLETENVKTETPLSMAILNGFEEVALKLIKKGANIHHRNDFFETPLWQAVANNRITLVEPLIERGADLEAQNRQGQTSLWVASLNGNLTIVKKLVQFKANINAMSQGYTPLLVAAQEGKTEVVNFLLSAGADIESRQLNNRRTALFLAVQSQRIETVQFLVNRKADIETRDKNERTPLMEAVIKGCTTIVSILLNAGANFNARDSWGQNALVLASYLGHKEIVRLLLSKNIEIAISEFFHHKKNTALHAAGGGGHLEIVKILLDYLKQKLCPPFNSKLMAAACRSIATAAMKCNQSHILDYLLNSEYLEFLKQNITDFLFGYEFIGNSLEDLLFCAASFDSGEGIKKLLAKEVSSEFQLPNGLSPLMTASMYGNCGAVEILINSGSNINLRGKKSETALMLASFNGHVDAVKLLLKHGAEIDAIADANETAFTLAVAGKQIQTLKYLLRFKLYNLLSKLLTLKEEKEKYWKLTGLISEKLGDYNLYFETNGNFSVGFKPEKASKKADTSKYILNPRLASNSLPITIVFNDLLNVVQRIFKEQQQNPEFNIDCLSDLLWETTDNYKATQAKELEAKALDEKSAVERKATEDKLAFEKELEACRAGLDYETISSQFPWVSGSTRDLSKIFEEMDAIHVQLNDLIEDSKIFLCSSIANRIEGLKLDKSNLEDQNQVLLKELKLLFKDRQKIEEEMHQLKQAYEHRYLELILRIQAKIDAKLLTDARNLRDALSHDPELKQILEKRAKLGDNIDLLVKQTNGLYEKAHAKRKIEQHHETQYYLQYERDSQQEETKLKLEKNRAIERQKREQEDKLRREKLIRKKQEARTHFAEKQAEISRNCEKIKQAELERRFDVRFQQGDVKKIDEELKKLTEALNQIKDADTKSLDERIKYYQGQGWLNFCAQLMEMIIQLPEDMALMSLYKASHFRNVVYHGQRLPQCRLDEIIQLTTQLVAYIKAIRKDDMLQKNHCWRLLNGFESRDKTLFVKILDHEIEDDIAFFEAKIYREQFEQEKSHRDLVQSLQMKSQVEFVEIFNSAIQLFDGRLGANAARIKQLYPRQFKQWNEALGLQQAIERGNAARHREQYEGFQHLIKAEAKSGEKKMSDENSVTRKKQAPKKERDKKEMLALSDGAKALAAAKPLVQETPKHEEIPKQEAPKKQDDPKQDALKQENPKQGKKAEKSKKSKNKKKRR